MKRAMFARLQPGQPFARSRGNFSQIPGIDTDCLRISGDDLGASRQQDSQEYGGGALNSAAGVKSSHTNPR